MKGNGEWGIGNWCLLFFPLLPLPPALTGVGILHSIRKSLFFRSEIFLCVPTSPRPRVNQNAKY
jgi:hypothetical protein